MTPDTVGRPVLLKLAEFRFLVVEHSLEIYGGLVAAVFSGLGVWLGKKTGAPPPERVTTIWRACLENPPL